MTDSAIRRLFILMLVCAMLAAAGCTKPPPNRYQGYAEGEFVLTAAQAAGRLEKRWVARGDTVEAGAPLFALERENELADRRGAEARVRSAEARYANLTTGLKPTEIDAAKAELAQAEAALGLSTVQLERNQQLFTKGYIAKSQLDEARTAHSHDLDAVAAARARLATARAALGREREIAAAKAEVDSAKEALAQSEWRLEQRAVRATGRAFVQDTFFSEGEWVPAGSPVVSLLPPANLKLRFFVPEAVVGTLKTGRPVQAVCDGCSSPVRAKISFISSQPEYTPPVIYSREQRSRLVFLVEATPEPADAGLLHPGQPLDVELK